MLQPDLFLETLPIVSWKLIHFAFLNAIFVLIDTGYEKILKEYSFLIFIKRDTTAFKTAAVLSPFSFKVYYYVFFKINF